MEEEDEFFGGEGRSEVAADPQTKKKRGGMEVYLFLLFKILSSRRFVVYKYLDSGTRTS